MQIEANITGIKYKCEMISKLKKFTMKDFDINNLPTSSIIEDDHFSFGLSKWVSPKRTRSYPYERLYNTLGNSKKITVIPIIKDEGMNGDRDFIQWDTVSLMSLLDIFVIFTYYNQAEKHLTRKNKITNQLFDNELVKEKIFEIKNYHSSALHWNLKEIEKDFINLIQKVKKNFRDISKNLNVKFHSEKGIDDFAKQFQYGLDNFMNLSREKAKKAQKREINTKQPKESLSSFTKSILTIENYLGGKYYFTTDEMEIKDKTIYLIEAKHSRTFLLSRLGDIKDGLLKMILYTNLKNVKIKSKKYFSKSILKLTSNQLTRKISSLDSNEQLKEFFSTQRFTKNQTKTIKNLFSEARNNHFIACVENVK